MLHMMLLYLLFEFQVLECGHVVFVIDPDIIAFLQNMDVISVYCDVDVLQCAVSIRKQRRKNQLKLMQINF